MSDAAARVLYVSYDGALDPLGRSQVVPYVEGLAARGHRFHLMTFEKPLRWNDASARGAMQERLARSEIRWHPLPYHKSPPVAGTAWDLAAGVRRATRIRAEHGLDLVHARSYPSTLIAHAMRSRHGTPYLFDMRGFYPEERVDGGLWAPAGPLFQVAKRLEAMFLRDAGGVVTLTEASLPVLGGLMERSGSRAPVRVIPTSVDLERFAPAPARREEFTLAYFGSIGTWYLLDEMLVLGRAFLDAVPRGRLLFVVNSEGAEVAERARSAGIPQDRLEIRSVPHEEVPAAVSGAHATFFLIKPAPSKVSSAATKFGESLALGIPVLVNRGVGDSARVVEQEGVGAVVEAFHPAAYRDAVERLMALAREPGVAARCRAAAEGRYDLAKAVDAYDALYRAILAGGGPHA